MNDRVFATAILRSVVLAARVVALLARRQRAQTYWLALVATGIQVVGSVERERE